MNNVGADTEDPRETSWVFSLFENIFHFKSLKYLQTILVHIHEIQYEISIFSLLIVTFLNFKIWQILQFSIFTSHVNITYIHICTFLQNKDV